MHWRASAGSTPRERTHFDGDSLDHSGTASRRDVGDLRQQSLADGQLVHSVERSASAQAFLCTLAAQTSASAKCSDYRESQQDSV